MALSVDYLYSFCRALIRKNQSGSVSGTEFGFFWNDSSTAYQDDLLGRFQKNNNGKYGINTGVIENKTILTKLSPFTIGTTLSVSGGFITRPSDFIFGLAMRVDGFEVYEINKGQIQSVTNSVIDPPSIDENAYYSTQYGSTYKIFPSTVAEVEFDYIKTPTDIVWGYTISAGRQVYDPGSSVQPEWDVNSCREITKRMLTDIGISFTSQDFQNFGNKVAEVGE